MIWQREGGGLVNVEVHKFGGSCLKTSDDLASIYHRLCNISAKPVVVISALWGVTDRLLRAIEIPSQREGIADEIRQRHLVMSPSLEDGDFTNRFEEIMVLLANDLQKLESESAGAAIEHRILAYGEQLSALVVASELCVKGLDARPVNAEDLRLIIDTKVNERSIDLQVSAKKMNRTLLFDNHIPIVTGWYGVDEEGVIRVLDRGGSDVTASSLAYLLQADQLVLWKDVEGILTINPRWGIGGKRVPYLGYSEANALANLGTTILHPTCLKPVEELGIPVILTSLKTESEGTIVGPDLHLSPPSVQAIASQESVRMLVIECGNESNTSSIARNALSQLIDAGVSPWSIQSTSDRIELIVSDNDAAVAFSCLHQTTEVELKMGHLSGVLSLVGAGISDDCGDLVEQVSHALAGVELTLHSVLRSKSVIHFLIDGELISQALLEVSRILDLRQDSLIQ